MHEGARGLSEDLEYSQEEWSRHEAVMMSISNSKTPEGAIATRAYNRLNELVTELELDPGITDMAHQVGNPSVTLLLLVLLWLLSNASIPQW